MKSNWNYVTNATRIAMLFCVGTLPDFILPPVTDYPD
jgi:hypothetical protein